MKAMVIIENGRTEVILTPENGFEEFVIEEAKKGKISAEAHSRYAYGDYIDHKITLEIK